MKGLTTRQREVLDAIKAREDFPPTISELAAITGHSRSLIQRRLDALQAKRYISRVYGAARSMRVIRR